ncbi:recombinase family protein [Streptomyces sp. NPDC058473]|uniref:recombinase family protein n=1 Tax=Streptomyces sp. NPDC058473 TaxID=3346517 RepID=UPI0036518329
MAEDGASTRDIVRWLDGAGVPGPGGKGWRYAYVARMLRHPVSVPGVLPLVLPDLTPRRSPLRWGGWRGSLAFLGAPSDHRLRNPGFPAGFERTPCSTGELGTFDP